MRDHVSTPTGENMSEVLDIFCEFSSALRPGNVLVVAGPRGCGKSTNLASWATNRQRRRVEGELLLQHYAGSCREALSLSHTLSRLVWAMGTFIGDKATEWNGAGRKELRGLVEGTLSEQRLMHTFTRYASAVLGGGSTGKSRLQRKSAKRLIIIIDGADKVLARDGKSSLRQRPKVGT